MITTQTNKNDDDEEERRRRKDTVVKTNKIVEYAIQQYHLAGTVG